TGREVTAVAHTAGAVLSLALHDRADVYAVDAGVDDLAHDVAVRAILVRDELGELLVATRDDLARLWVDQVCRKHATGQPGAVLVRSQLRPVGVVAARPHTGFRAAVVERDDHVLRHVDQSTRQVDRKSTRLNSSHVKISYAVFCLKKKKKQKHTEAPRR